MRNGANSQKQNAFRFLALHDPAAKSIPESGLWGRRGGKKQFNKPAGQDREKGRHHDGFAPMKVRIAMAAP